MSLSKPTTEQLLQQLLEQSTRTNELLQALATKAYNAELRQCHASGECTDAIRMGEFYYRAESALLSSHTQRTLVEMLYESGGLEGVEYHKVFGDKDTRRAELAAVVFYKTFHEKKKPYNIFETATEHMHEMLKDMPSFRKMALENARKIDREIGEQNKEKLSFGPYVERIQQALGELPLALQLLHDLMRPLDKQHKPLPKIREEHADDIEDAYEHLPKDIKAFIEYAETSGLVSSGDKSLATTELVVKWCREIAELSTKQWELEEDEYFDKTKMNWADAEDYASRQEVDKKILSRRFETSFPEYDAINKKHERLLAKKAAEKAAEKTATAEASGEQAPESPK